MGKIQAFKNPNDEVALTVVNKLPYFYGCSVYTSFVLCEYSEYIFKLVVIRIVFLFFETLSLYVCNFMLISLKYITNVVRARI